MNSLRNGLQSYAPVTNIIIWAKLHQQHNPSFGEKFYKVVTESEHVEDCRNTSEPPIGGIVCKGMKVEKAVRLVGIL